MKSWVRVGTAMCATLIATVLGTGVAHADRTDDYLRRVSVRLPYVYDTYSSNQILREGYRICGYEAMGVDLSTEIGYVTSELPMSRSSAITLVAIAKVWLECE